MNEIRYTLLLCAGFLAVHQCRVWGTEESGKTSNASVQVVDRRASSHWGRLGRLAHSEITPDGAGSLPCLSVPLASEIRIMETQ
jgi:hypothetical protein